MGGELQEGQKPRVEGYFNLKSRVKIGDDAEMVVEILVEKDDTGHYHYDFLLDRQTARGCSKAPLMRRMWVPLPKAGDSPGDDPTALDAVGQEPAGRLVVNLFIEGEALEEGVEDEGEAGTPAPASPAAELSDDPNSPNYRYRDTGYIADSRKERAAALILDAKKGGLRLRASDIDFDMIEQNPRQAKEVIVKANLFGKTDWQALERRRHGASRRLPYRQGLREHRGRAVAGQSRRAPGLRHRPGVDPRPPARRYDGDRGAGGSGGDPRRTRRHHPAA